MIIRLKGFCFTFYVFGIFFVAGPLSAARFYNQMAIEYPLDGGFMVMGSRMLNVNKYVDVGLTLGGGQINRNFDLSVSGHDVPSETKSLVLPFIGPRVRFVYQFIGVSLGGGIFYSDTDFDVSAPPGFTQPLSGSKKGWGTVFYSPFLALEFFHAKTGMIYGLGLGGFLGSSFSNLTASSSEGTITTNEHPLDTLTFHASITWSPKWRQHRGGW